MMMRGDGACVVGCVHARRPVAMGRPGRMPCCATGSAPWRGADLGVGLGDAELHDGLVLSERQ